MMKKIFTKDLWKLENLKERLSQLPGSLRSAIDNLLESAGGRLDRKQKLAL